MLAALLTAGATSAYAQDADPAAPTTPPLSQETTELATPAEGADIVVTGSRIRRDGYDQPTPVTVVGAAEIQAVAPANIADFVNQIPAVSGSVVPATSQRQLSAGNAGVNTINLRNLGSVRTLVLLDGKRSVGSVAQGTVDVNTIPQGLVRSVEVVTGGASSVYGSDAVAGVVNFILDRTFTGLKGEASYGITTYGDDANYRLSLTAGVPFAEGRGRLLLNGEVTGRDGVFGAPRPWADDGYHLTQNPAYAPGNGQPELLPTARSGLNTLTGGGIITGDLQGRPTPFRGIYFGEGGSINRYDFGENRVPGVGSPWTVGGSWRESQHFNRTSLQPEEERIGVFGRLSFDVFDNLNVFTELSWNRSDAFNAGGPQTDKGNIAIQGDNAFIPAALRSQLNGAGFRIGTWNAEVPTRTSDNRREVERYLIGVEGSFGLLGSDWNWDAYAQRGIARAHEEVYAARLAKQNFAADAVRDSSGNIVCRVTRDRSTNPLAQGCVPFNRLGINVQTDAELQAAYNYFMGRPFRDQKFQQDVAALHFNTNFANPWLDPIGLAFGIEHRKEQISGFSPPEFATNWAVGNYLASTGSYKVTEGFVETLVPLPFDIDFSGAARYTRYSQSGSVVTWKTGLTWEPVPDVRLRVTRSRDIRAPNLAELFQAGTRNTNSLADPWQNNRNVRFTQTVAGNLALDPEKADTLGLGVVYRPSFLPGLGISVDYFDIKLKGAIATLTPQQIIDRCFGGNIELCQRLTAILNSGGVETTVPFGSAGFNNTSGPGITVTDYLVANSPFNFQQFRVRGIDIEASYQFALDNIFADAPGTVNLRAFATHYLEDSVSNGIDAPTENVGENSGDGPPDWVYRITLGYETDNFDMQIIGRGISGGVYDNDYVECASNCPATSPIAQTISNNNIPGAFYLDTYFAYKLPAGDGQTQLFFRVGNILNTDPVNVGKGPADTSNVEVGSNLGLYDFLGRTFRVGVRFSLGGS